MTEQAYSAATLGRPCGVQARLSKKCCICSDGGHPFEISTYRGLDEPEWILEITNAKGTSFIPDERFKTDKYALGVALADFENEPIEDFLG